MLLALFWVEADGLQRLRWRKRPGRTLELARASISRFSRRLGGRNKPPRTTEALADPFRHEVAKIKEKGPTTTPPKGPDKIATMDRITTKIVDPDESVPYSPSFGKQNQDGDATAGQEDPAYADRPAR